MINLKEAFNIFKAVAKTSSVIELMAIACALVGVTLVVFVSVLRLVGLIVWGISVATPSVYTYINPE